MSFCSFIYRYAVLAGLVVTISPLGTAAARSISLEQDGILAIEAESSVDLPSQEWVFESDIAGFSGDGYLRAQRTSFNTPGFGILGYDFLVTNTADYQFAFSSRIGLGTSRSEHNDSWVRLVDEQGQGITPIANNNDTRAGEWHKVFMNVNGSWAHNASNRDRDARSLAWNLVEGTQYELQISSRSEDHLVDRLILWDRDRYNFANEATGTNPNNVAFRGLATSIVVPEPASAALILMSVAGIATRRRSIHCC